MELLDTLRHDILMARKTKNEHAAFLVLVHSDILSAAKSDGDRQPNDDDAFKVIKKAVKDLDADLADPKFKGSTEFLERAQGQRNALAKYIPEAIDEDLLKMSIRDAAQSIDVPVEVRSMGKIIPVLKQMHPGQIDGAQVRRLLEAGVC